MKHRFALIAGLALCQTPTLAGAQVFEVIHPDVVKGGFELEVLNGVTLSGVEDEDERSAHEIAIAYSPFSFWKTTFAIEIANPSGENADVEGYEWENVFLLPFGSHGGGHDHDHDDEGSGLSLGAVGLFVALEVPDEGGFDEGALEVGPIVEFEIGPVETIANFFVEIPFEDGEDPGFSYALSAAVPVGAFASGEIAAGFEAFGGVEGAFGDATPFDDNSHVIGPALYSEFDIGQGRTLEPRLAFLVGLTEESPDAVLSFNVELKF